MSFLLCVELAAAKSLHNYFLVYRNHESEFKDCPGLSELLVYLDCHLLVFRIYEEGGFLVVNLEIDCSFFRGVWLIFDVIFANPTQVSCTPDEMSYGS